jgi:hypothetical protein
MRRGSWTSNNTSFVIRSAKLCNCSKSVNLNVLSYNIKLCSQGKLPSHCIFDAVVVTDVHKEEDCTLEHCFVAVWCIYMYTFYSQTVRTLRSGNELPFVGTSIVSSERIVSALTQLMERCSLFTLLKQRNMYIMKAFLKVLLTMYSATGLKHTFRNSKW